MKAKSAASRLQKWKNAVNSLWATQTPAEKKSKPSSRIGAFILLHKWELLVMFLVGGFVFYLASIQPFDSGPDEELRYRVNQFIYKYGKLPRGTDEEVISRVWGVSYAYKPCLTSIIGGYLMRFMGMFSTDTFLLLMTARFVNVLFGMGFAWYVMQIGKRLFKGIYKIFFIMLILLLPQVTYLFTYVNNDGIALFSTAMIIFYWLKGTTSKWNRQSCIGTAVGCSFCIMSYYNSYGFLLISAILFICSMRIHYRGLSKENIRLILGRGGFILAIAFVLTGWWFIRNAIIYDGDFLGVRVINEYAEIYAQEAYKPSVKQSLFEQGVSFKEMLFGEKYLWVQETYYSFIAYFGAKQYRLGTDIYHIHINIIGLSVCGFAVIFVRKARELFGIWKNKGRMSAEFKQKIALYVSLAAAMIIPVFLSLYYSYKDDFQPQGRYIMPMVIPLMIFLTMGVQAVLQFVFKRKAWIMMIPQFYGIIHVFYDAYVNVCLPVFGVTVPFLDPVFPWLTNFRWFDRIRNFIIRSLFPG